MDDMTIEQLGAHALAHYTQGEKANKRANDHAKSAGLYLIELRNRVAKRKDMTFASALFQYCNIGKSRAYELIAIAEGRDTHEELIERNRQWKDTWTQRNRAARAAAGMSIRNGRSATKSTTKSIIPDAARAKPMARLNELLRQLSVDELWRLVAELEGSHQAERMAA